MRIPVNDFSDDLYEAEYVEPEANFVPGGKQQSTEPVSESVEEDKQRNIVNELVDNHQSMSLGISLNLRKFLTIAGMFLIMFLIPVGVADGWLSPGNISPKEVYTADALGGEGRVAGVSVSNTQSSVQNNTSQFFDREVMGLSMGLVFIILGVIFISIPTVILLR